MTDLWREMESRGGHMFRQWSGVRAQKPAPGACRHHAQRRFISNPDQPGTTATARAPTQSCAMSSWMEKPPTQNCGSGRAAARYINPSLHLTNYSPVQNIGQATCCPSMKIQDGYLKKITCPDLSLLL